MTSGCLARTPSKRWVNDDEVAQCPLCSNRFEGNFLDITLSGRTHCRYCGGVFCTNCCNQELYMPEDEVVRPPASAKLKIMVFDPTQKQKACRTCVKVMNELGAAHKSMLKFDSGVFVHADVLYCAPIPITTSIDMLMPQQEALKASRGRGSTRLNGFGSRKSPAGPHFAVVAVRAKSLRSRRGNPSVMDPVCLLTVGHTSSFTQPTQDGPDPVWNQNFEFPVQSEHGNTLKLTCYEEAAGGKTLIGEGSTKVEETGTEGVWVPITDERRAVTGEVLVKCTYRGTRTSRAGPLSAARGTRPRNPLLVGHEMDTDEGADHPVPLLHWLQEKAWLVYVVLLLASVLWRFALSRGFSGDPIALKPGTPNGNNVSKRSDTHYMTLLKDGNLVLREGKPGDPVQKEPLWESGRPFAKKDCKKCVFLLDETGQQLMVKDGRKVLMSFNVREDGILSQAIKGP